MGNISSIKIFGVRDIYSSGWIAAKISTTSDSVFRLTQIFGVTRCIIFFQADNKAQRNSIIRVSLSPERCV